MVLKFVSFTHLSYLYLMFRKTKAKLLPESVEVSLVFAYVDNVVVVVVTVIAVA